MNFPERILLTTEAKAKKIWRQGGQQGSILDGPIQGRKAQVALVCNLRVPRSQTGIETVKAQVLQLLLLKWAWRWVMRQSRI